MKSHLIITFIISRIILKTFDTYLVHLKKAYLKRQGFSTSLYRIHEDKRRFILVRVDTTFGRPRCPDVRTRGPQRPMTSGLVDVPTIRRCPSAPPVHDPVRHPVCDPVRHPVRPLRPPSGRADAHYVVTTTFTCNF